jgi:hypothetical protein
MSKQCPSCGGDCGGTKQTGCKYKGRLTDSELIQEAKLYAQYSSIEDSQKLVPDMDIEAEIKVMNTEYDKWATENTPVRESMAWHDGFCAALKLLKRES